MTDQQVVDFIKQQSTAGKTEQEIGKMLLARGVTPDQAKRIKQKYQSELQSQSSGTEARAGASTRLRQTAETGTRSQNQNSDMMASPEEGSQGFYNEYIIEEGNNTSETGRQIFGQRVFNSRGLTFEPSENLATPQNYILGPGDEVIIDIWGANEDHIRQFISPEGSIMIEQIGPVYLNGMTINQANNLVKNTFAKKYAGMSDEETDIQVTLGQVRTIQVDILGEVATPGTYRLSPFATVFNGLYNAGGINDIGTLRNIQVLRNGKIVAGVDVYDYLFEGKSKGNIRLQEGDVIIVPPYEQLVNVEGNVKRPMYYEIKPNETIQDLLNFAGGFTGEAYSDVLILSRQTGTQNELYNIEKGEFDTYRLKDGDLLTIGTILDRYTNRVELQGAVYRPGMYAISPNVQTIGQLISTAEGLTEDAYRGRALLYREGPELQLQIMAIDLDDILNGVTPDIELKPNDLLVVSSIQELESRGALTINGQVLNPGSYPFADHTTVEDLILQAGGLLEGASTARVDISRRIIDPTSMHPTQQLAEVFSVSIESGLGVNRGQNFELMPYDVVTVRTSPGYETQEFVSVEGEVLFNGEFVLQKRNERITDIIQRAGGILEDAYIKGAHLERQLTEDEYLARQEAIRFAMANSGPNQGDSIDVNKIDIGRVYNVGIDLEKALSNPGSTYDLVLQPGDRLFIPQQQSTVKISGDVMFPNTVVYEEGKKLKHYINQAGGYGQKAKKNKAFIVYMNGTVAQAKRNTPIEPGCQIIVPTKPENGGVDWTKILTLTTSFGSIATMAATIYSIFR
ncbi:MAG: SLBB domain-containing protein [Muribaculaceae bacterium]|nr:SLBB domain-containing protein [Muribaculaceae bacterium]